MSFDNSDYKLIDEIGKQLHDDMQAILPSCLHDADDSLVEAGNIAEILSDGLSMIAQAIDRLTAAIEKQREAK